VWRDRIWAAAYALSRLPKEDHPHWLDQEESEALRARAALYKGEDGWLDAIEAHCVGRDFVTVTDIFVKALQGSTDKLDKRQTDRITNILRELGCEKGLQRRGKDRVRGWSVSQALREAEVPPRERERRKGEALAEGILFQKNADAP
jgi:predicted P-loop ATPase